MRIAIGAPGNGALLKEAIEERLVEDERVSDVVDLSAPEITYPEVSFRVADPCAAHTWSPRVSQIRVNFDLTSYAADPSALPAQVLEGCAQMRQGRALYEVIADFAVSGEPC